MIDGFNLITTIEAALSGGVILAGRDGCYRDMASMHGTYRKVNQTLPAINAIGSRLADLKIEKCCWYLDAPVSNSGRLCTWIREYAREHGYPWTVQLVDDPDKVLIQSHDVVVSAGSVVIDRCRRWFNLARDVCEQLADEIWLVDLEK